MKVKVFAGLVGVLSFVSFSAHANWICNVQNLKGQHWTFSAPTEAAANAMAKNACDANSVNPNNCNPVCNNAGSPRWHCVVANQRNQHWSFYAPTQAQAFNMAKTACDANSINPNNCNPSCLPE